MARSGPGGSVAGAVLWHGLMRWGSSSAARGVQGWLLRRAEHLQVAERGSCGCGGPARLGAVGDRAVPRWSVGWGLIWSGIEELNAEFFFTR